MVDVYLSLSLSRALAVAIRSLAPPALPLGWRETGSPVARHLSDSDSPPPGALPVSLGLNHLLPLNQLLLPVTYWLAAVHTCASRT